MENATKAIFDMGTSFADEQVSIVTVMTNAAMLVLGVDPLRRQWWKRKDHHPSNAQQEKSF